MIMHYVYVYDHPAGLTSPGGPRSPPPVDPHDKGSSSSSFTASARAASACAGDLGSSGPSFFPQAGGQQQRGRPPAPQPWAPGREGPPLSPSGEAGKRPEAPPSPGSPGLGFSFRDIGRPPGEEVDVSLEIAAGLLMARVEADVRQGGGGRGDTEGSEVADKLKRALMLALLDKQVGFRERI